MGSVFEGWDPELKRAFALEVLNRARGRHARQLTNRAGADASYQPKGGTYSLDINSFGMNWGVEAVGLSKESQPERQDSGPE